MIKNYIKVAIRNILKYKFFSAINILGMTIGLSACLLISLYVIDELSFDQFHENADRIYQVGLHGKIGDQDIRTASTCPPMSKALVSEIPEIESSTRIAPYFGQPAFKYGDLSFAQDKVFFVDSNFFDFFSFKLLEGDANTALKDTQSLILTTETAKKYFGDKPALGELMIIGSENKTYKVTGIIENAPSNSHFIYNALVPAHGSEDLNREIWLNNFIFTYYTLRENASVDQVNAKFEDLVVKYIGPELERFMGATLKQMRESGGEFGYFSTKLADIHLRSAAVDGLEAAGNITYVYFFAGIGIFILVIGCINFMNMSTARSAGRAKEVGLRKTLGSLRGQLINQFLSESIIYSLVAVILSIAASYFLLPYFNLLSGKDLNISSYNSPLFILGFIGMILFVGLLAGSYPAFYLTSFNAVEVLKGKVRAGMKSKGVRSVLVVFQFALSIFLIIFTSVVYQQISFMQEKNIGIDKNNVIVVQNTGRLGTNSEAFRNALMEQTGIEKTSYTNNNFPGVNNTTVFKEAGSEQDHIMGLYYADYDHMDVMKFEMASGRYFSKDFPSDSTAIILNEAAIREFNFPDLENAEVLYNEGGEGMKKHKVIGVIKNFNFESFKTDVRPLAIMLTNNSRNLMIRYSGNSADVVNKLEGLWKQYSNNEPLDFEFMDQSFDKLFRAEQRMGEVFSVFAGLAIFVACLGLFALSAFTSEQRTKEIGIRKAMGASSLSLTILLTKEFTTLVIIAFIPAAAVAWYVSNSWLQGFAYRIDINPFIVLLSGVASFVIAWLTVSFQSIKASLSNPVNSLRYE